jgi:hypothetical protein
LATLRVALTGTGYSEAFGIGEFSWANASRGWLMTGAFAKTGGGGTIVGRLVSITIASGHLCAELMRVIDLFTRASRRKLWEEAFGKYQSEKNSIPRSRFRQKRSSDLKALDQ